MFGRFKSLMPFSRMSEDEYRRQQEAIIRAAPVPVIWLLGKTGSGKSSIVRLLTQSPAAEIGAGFRPQTTHSSQYDFPSPENPVIRFLDTRGLGEGRYDATEDVTAFNQSAHVVLVTVRAMDHSLGEVLRWLKQIRSARRDRPVVLAVSCLHEAYPQQQHPSPDPFLTHPLAPGAKADQLSPQLPEELRRSLALQCDRFQGLVDRIVPIDLTPPEDGFEEPEFGGQRLKQTVLELLPEAYRQTLLHLEDALQPLDDLRQRKAMPYVVGYSTMAATAAAAPVPWIDIPAVLAIQSHLIYKLAAIYKQQMNARLFLEITGAVAGQLVTQMVLRESLKLVPFVGVAANAALAYAYTYGLGKAACWYFVILSMIADGTEQTT